MFSIVWVNKYKVYLLKNNTMIQKTAKKLIASFELNIYFSMNSLTTRVNDSISGEKLLKSGLSGLKFVAERLSEGFEKNYGYKESEIDLRIAWTILLDKFYMHYKIEGGKPSSFNTLEEKIDWCLQNAR